MEEQETPPVKADNNSDPETSKTTPLIEIANQAAKRMEEANKETARLFDLQEKRDARMALGGEGGGPANLKLISEDELKKKNAAKFFEGTLLEKDILQDEKK